MFDPAPGPRVFCTPLGVDFSAQLIAGLDDRLAGQPPHALARVEIFIASDRMRRRIEALYAERQASFLPRLTPVGRIADRPELFGLPDAMSPLGLRLQLVRLIGVLLDSNPRLAPRSAMYDLADSLATLMAEMHEEEVSPQAIANLQTEAMQEHWKQSAAFLDIIARYFGSGDGGGGDGDGGGSDKSGGRLVPAEARQAMAIYRLADRWSQHPPDHPVIVAGSTGSRGATARLMEAVARLPQGAVVLPGLDADMPRPIWQRLLQDRRSEGLAGEDHPQFRLCRFADRMGLDPASLPHWTAAPPAVPERNAWLSLALRPAPVTDAWLRKAPALVAGADPAQAFARATLLEAPSPRAEAITIAYRLREAAETGQRATLVTADRMLGRAVTAALDRWGILPDDSAGLPLDMTAPGRMLGLVADLMAGRGDAVELLAVLSHPLTCAGGDRQAHLRHLDSLELTCLRGGALHPSAAQLRGWAEDQDDAGARDWAEWVIRTALDARADTAPMSQLVTHHRALAQALAAGPGDHGPEALWAGDDGQKADARMREIATEAELGGEMSPRDYRDLITAILSDTELRNPVRPHAGVMIWGAMEARVQGAELMILGGLNEGSWPAGDTADPWLNRKLRAEAGLRLPDRRTGLSAHDFQQAAAAPEVWYSRAARDAEAETVPSRWLNRLTNLLEGSGAQTKATLDQMRRRGRLYLEQALALEAPDPGTPVPRAPRTAPAPPIEARPRRLSVTQIETLIRDPFAIYASKVLRLYPLDPLRPQPDARLKGTLLHDILHRFSLETTPGPLPPDAEARLIAIADAELAKAAAWPVARHLWRASVIKAARAFVQGEAERRAFAEPMAFEIKGEASFPPLGVTLSGKADRIDRLPSGALVLYDYKSGNLPNEKTEQTFQQQLRLEAAMAARGAFPGGAAETAHLAYIRLNESGDVFAPDLPPGFAVEAEQGLLRLWGSYLEAGKGFMPRRAMFLVNYESDYQHLARYGEWDDADDAVTVEVGR